MDVETAMMMVGEEGGGTGGWEDTVDLYDPPKSMFSNPYTNYASCTNPRSYLK